MKKTANPLLTVLALLLLAGVLFMEFQGVRAFSERYRELAAQELTAEDISYISFSDGLLADLAYAGTKLPLVTHADDDTVPPYLLLLYDAKALLRIFLPFFLRKKSKKPQDVV